MERVGGYQSWLLLNEDARAYDDVMIILEGEADAKRVQELEERLKASRGH